MLNIVVTLVQLLTTDMDKKFEMTGGIFFKVLKYLENLKLFLMKISFFSNFTLLNFIKFTI